MRNLVVLGAGTAGTLVANRLAAALSAREWKITVCDRDNEHHYQPGYLFVPFGIYKANEIARERSVLLPDGVDLVLDPIAAIEPGANRVVFEGGATLRYDVLVVATGAHVAAEETEGLTGVGWRETASDFYTLEGAVALRDALAKFEGGTIAVAIAELPIKCPVAPLEFAFLAEAYLTQRGIREKSEVVYVTPLDGAFTKPVASRTLGAMLGERGVHVEANFVTAKVDGERRVLESYDGREVQYDLLAFVPLHRGVDVVRASGLSDELGFVMVDKETLQSKKFANVFAIGDAADTPTSKAGSVAHFQGETLIANVLRFINGEALEAGFDGHANCFIETGYDKAMLLDFNYTTEPLPGKFPLPGVGPFDLLRESEANHWGKLAFRWVYWNLLVRGKELPIEHRMSMAGKEA